MRNASSNLRKAAVLIRSLDAETAATMLAQLSTDEAHALRDAIRSLGPIDPEEQADVAAELRRATPLAAQPTADGVELRLTSIQERHEPNPLRDVQRAVPGDKPFEFLAQAPMSALVPYLAREHVQTIAVVLSHLSPDRAAAVLAALPDKLQADTLERLTVLGDIDPYSVTVVAQELAAWLGKRSVGKPSSARRRDVVTSILASTDVTTRNQIMTNLKTFKAGLAAQLAPLEGARATRSTRKKHEWRGARESAHIASRFSPDLSRRSNTSSASSSPPGRIDFDQLIHLDGATLAAVLRDVDASVVVLALAGSREEFIDRICDQMPKRASRAFRRQLRRLGPTRLSDVEAAQQVLAQAAARQLAARRTTAAAFNN